MNCVHQISLWKEILKHFFIPQDEKSSVILQMMKEYLENLQENKKLYKDIKDVFIQV